MTSILTIVRLNRDLVRRYIKVFDSELKRLMEQVDESVGKNAPLDRTQMKQKIEVLNQIRHIHVDINARYKTYESQTERKWRQIVESHDLEAVNK